MSAKQSVGKAVLGPLLAAGTSVAASYVAKKGPAFVEETVLPKLREASSRGDLAEQMTDRARQATGRAGDASGGGDTGGGNLSQSELSRRSEERAKRRAQRRKTTKK